MQKNAIARGTTNFARPASQSLISAFSLRLYSSSHKEAREREEHWFASLRRSIFFSVQLSLSLNWNDVLLGALRVDETYA